MKAIMRRRPTGAAAFAINARRNNYIANCAAGCSGAAASRPARFGAMARTVWRTAHAIQRDLRLHLTPGADRSSAKGRDSARAPADTMAPEAGAAGSPRDPALDPACAPAGNGGPAPCAPPEFSAARTATVVWNRSASFSSSEEYPSADIFACSAGSSGIGMKGSGANSSGIVTTRVGGSLAKGASLAWVALSSSPLTGSPFASWKPAIAFLVESPSFPSITPRVKPMGRAQPELA